MLKKLKVYFSLVLSLSLIFSCLFFSTVQADTKGYLIYGAPSDSRSFYERAVKLGNGDLLCTFSRTSDNQGVYKINSFYFCKSSDKGKTWSRVSTLDTSNYGFNVESQYGGHALYILPKQMGNYPAGTLLFATGDANPSSPYIIHIWRSTDNGVTWQLHSSLAKRGTNDPAKKSNMLWEPEFAVSGDGTKLICYYSDERQANYDQCIAYETSTDGGITWGNYKIIIGQTSTGQGWRPGMPRVIKLKNGSYFMVYESIGSTPAPAGAVRFKISPDGLDWGSAGDPGKIVGTATSTAFQCPEVGLVDDGSTYGRLFVRGMNDTCAGSKCFTSKDNGATWSEIDAPLTAFRNEHLRGNWSGTFLSDGNILYELNNCYNGSYNEIRCGIGIVNADDIIVAGAFYTMTNQKSGLCLDDPGGSTEPGTQMIQWTPNNLDTQAWKADFIGNNFFKLTCKYSNLVLDNKGGLPDPGNPILQWNDNGTDAQRWSIGYIGNSYYKIKNKASGLYMDVSGGSTQAHASIVQNADNGSTSQNWKLKQHYSVSRFRSYNYPKNFIRHELFRLKMGSDFTTLPIEDSEFKVVAGLNGDPNCISLLCTNSDMTNYYIRHKNGEVWAERNDGSALFKADASFKMKQGLADNSNPNLVSFETSNIAGVYIRHRDGLLYVQPISANSDKADATFTRLQQ